MEGECILDVYGISIDDVDDLKRPQATEVVINAIEKATGHITLAAKATTKEGQLEHYYKALTVLSSIMVGDGSLIPDPGLQDQELFERVCRQIHGTLEVLLLKQS